jgi:NAD(P)-dependent dehydrogenase (short-subunit alcohol dehydrogenase family)
VVQDVLGYAGKRVIVTGAATEAGEATARILVDLGVEVHALDLTKPDVTGLASYTACDLGDPEQIDDAVAKIGRVVNALFNCGGRPRSLPPIDALLVDFCGVRHVTEAVIPNLQRGGAIVSIASTAGSGWQQNLDLLSGLLQTPEFAAARAWCEAHLSELADGGALANQAVNAYTALRSLTLAAAGIRINCVNPAPADAPPDVAWPLVFLNSPRAAGVTGRHL